MRKFIALVVFFVLFSISAPVLALDAPTLTVTTSGTNVSLSWLSVTGATGYTLFYAPYPDASPIGQIDMGTQTSISFDGNGLAFYVAIQSYNISGSSAYSNIEFFQISSGTESSEWVIDEIKTVNNSDNSYTNIITFYYDNSENNIKTLSMYNSSGVTQESKTINTFDQNHFLIKSVQETTSTNQTYLKTTSEYTNNQKGYPTHIDIVLDYDNGFTAITTKDLVYDTCNNVIKSTIKSNSDTTPSSTSIMKSDYTYGTNCQILIVTVDGLSKTVYEYNSLGEISKVITTTYNKYSGDQISTALYSYDTNGNLSEIDYGDSITTHTYKKL